MVASGAIEATIASSRAGTRLRYNWLVPCPPANGSRRFGLVVVRGRSMEPTLYEGDLLLVRWGTGRAATGRLAVVRLPGDRPVAVKRLVRHEPDGWWVERDNPREGVDSWLVGAVPDRDLLGTVTLRIWPWRRAAGPPGTAG